ncbi:MAG: type II secretion system F family protein [Patescibacteria group bacterium]
MRFHYTATKLDGRIVEGELEAENSQEALAFLAARELRPISLSVAGKTRLKARQIYLGKAINATDKIFLSKHLALMLKLGTDLFKALDILIADTDKPALKDFLQEIRGTLEKGQRFYVTFARYPNYFSPVFINLVKAGESSGNLGKTFEDLSEMLSKQEDLRRKISAALIYPIVLLVASFLILTFLVTFALPRIAAVFLQGGLEVPFFSKVVFAVGLFLADNIWLIGSLFLAVVGFLFYFFARTVTGRKVFFYLLNKIPVVGSVVRKVAIQRFASTLSTLMKAGVPIINSLEITAMSVGHQGMKDALNRIAKEGVARGLSLGEAFKRETVFPLAVNSLIAISEKAGHLDEVLATLSTFYDSEIESAIKTMVSFIEPALLVFIGAIVALIALSVIVPVYQLVGQF